MAGIRLNIASNEIRAMYDALMKEGIDPKLIDLGWNRGNSVTGANDGVIEDNDVLTYVYSNWEKYQKLIQDVGQFKVTWALDDLNPQTTFDETVRAKTKALISAARQKLSKQGYVPGQLGYLEILAFEIYESVQKDPFFLRGTRMFQVNAENSGRTGAYRLAENVTALTFLKKREGKCTEITNVLFGIFSMAGYKVRAVDVSIDDDGDFMDHVALQVQVDAGKWIIVDAAQNKFSPTYKVYRPLSNAEFGSIYYTYASGVTKTFYFPSSSAVSDGNKLLVANKPGEAIQKFKNRFWHPDDPRSELYCLSYLKEKGEEAKYIELLKAFEKRYPNMFERLVRYLEMSMGQRIFVPYGRIAVLHDLATNPEQKKAAHLIEMKYNLMNKEDWSKALEISLKMLDKNSKEDDFAAVGNLMREANYIDGLGKISSMWSSQHSDSMRARFAVMYVKYIKGDYKAIIKAGAPILQSNKIKEMKTNMVLILIQSYAKTGNFKTALRLLRIKKTQLEKDLDGDRVELLKYFILFALGNVEELKKATPVSDINKATCKLFSLLLAKKKNEAADIFFALPFMKEPIVAMRFFRSHDFLPSDKREWIKGGLTINFIARKFVAEDGKISLEKAKQLLKFPDDESLDKQMTEEERIATLGIIRKALDRSKVFAAIWGKEALKYYKESVTYKVISREAKKVTITILSPRENRDDVRIMSKYMVVQSNRFEKIEIEQEFICDADGKDCIDVNGDAAATPADDGATNPYEGNLSLMKPFDNLTLGAEKE